MPDSELSDRSELSAVMEKVAVAAADVEFRMHGPEKCEIAVGPRTYALTADPAALQPLADVITQVVPRMRRSAPIRRQLTEAEARRLSPFMPRLRDMGVLLFPGENAVIDGEPGRRLYSYICRRAAEPDRVFSGIRAKRIHVTGPEPVVSVWNRLLREQGLNPAGPEPEADAALRIVADSDEARLAAANRTLCADRRSWLPVRFGAQRVRIGPWVRAGESGCLRCHLPARPEEERAREPGPAAGWATLQPGCLYWTGGLVAHLALRALLPMAAEHPWGRVTTMDAATGEQTSLTAWRDPFCPDCAGHTSASREWVAL
ncbi:TOMM precursor leader peptide-binding protein [Streptomyces roseifaciens]